MSDTPPQKIWIDTEIYEKRWHDHDVGESMDCFGPYHHDDTVQALVRAVEQAGDAIEFYYTNWRLAGMPGADDSNVTGGHLLALNALDTALAPFQQEGE